ncbi:MAG TPA: tyrosine-type recombinase/integrase [Oscillospiraceae bacterium]|nr:tyrosine-type recombinase/integrase [Oscillospiraceae bacterium]
MLFNEALKLFQDHLLTIGRSPNTIHRYLTDLTTFYHAQEHKQNGAAYLADINSTDLEQFLYNLQQQGIAPNSRSRFIYTFRSFYKFAYKKELVPRDIAQTLDVIKLPTTERTYLNQCELEELIAAIQHKLIRLLVIFLANTGLRISESLHLTLHDVDLAAGLIQVRQGKGGKDRKVPINQKLLPLLQDYRENWRDAYGSDFFFATKKTGSLSNVYVNSIIRQTVKKLGWSKQVSAHTLRHSFASNLIRKKVGLVEIQKLLGHSSLTVTSIYTHTDLAQLTAAVNTL